MSIDSENNDDVGLWECLHDGSLESLTHNRLDRTITLVVDVPYIWSFHNMPPESRFHIVLHDVLTVESLAFQPWPRQTVIPSGLSWNEQQTIWTEMQAKGFLSSSDWAAFCARIEIASEYEFSHAYLSTLAAGQIMFVAELANYAANDYTTMRITAGHINFLIDSNKEMILPEFLSLGKAYWDDFATRSEAGSGNIAPPRSSNKCP
jgi:hypothetical protein